MLIHSKKLYDDRLAALDGEIGRVKDIYFDDKNWVVRYVVADTGSWLNSRMVLLSPHAFDRIDEMTGVLRVNLTRAQIEQSPPIDSHKPVSRQYEVDYYRYYGWPFYWNGGGMWGMASYPVIVPPPKAEINDDFRMHHREDKHLQSAHAINGYGIEGSDGNLGFMRGLLLDDRSWAIREIAVDAGHWFSEKEIRISTAEVERIHYEESRIFVRLAKGDIRRTLENRVAAGEPISVAATD